MFWQFISFIVVLKLVKLVSFFVDFSKILKIKEIMSGESKSDDKYNTYDEHSVNHQDESKEDITMQKSNTTKNKEEKEILINPTDFQRLVDNFVDYASKGNLEKVRKLYESNPNILDMKRSNTGLTALHVCSEFGYDKVCKYLLDNKADVNTRSKVLYLVLFLSL